MLGRLDCWIISAGVLDDTHSLISFIIDCYFSFVWESVRKEVDSAKMSQRIFYFKFHMDEKG